MVRPGEHHRLGALGGVVVLAHVLGGHLEARASGLEVVGGQVPGDGHQPGAEVLALPAEALHRAQGPEERLGGEVLGQRGRPRAVEQEAVDRALVVVVEQAEGVDVSLAGQLDEGDQSGAVDRGLLRRRGQGAVVVPVAPPASRGRRMGGTGRCSMWRLSSATVCEQQLQQPRGRARRARRPRRAPGRGPRSGARVEVARGGVVERRGRPGVAGRRSRASRRRAAAIWCSLPCMLSPRAIPRVRRIRRAGNRNSRIPQVEVSGKACPTRPPVRPVPQCCRERSATPAATVPLTAPPPRRPPARHGPPCARCGSRGPASPPRGRGRAAGRRG